ncbi:MAG: hypothetical protein ACE5ED_06190 [Rhodothalassiaceae bacterium]
MNIPRLIAAIVAAYIVLFVLAMLFYEMLFAEQFAVFGQLMGGEGAEPGIWAYLGYLLQVVMVAILFVKGYENKGVGEGVRFGVLAGLLLGAVDFTWGVHLAAVPTGTAFLSGVVSFVMWLIAGIVLALVYKPAEATSGGEAA